MTRIDWLIAGFVALTALLGFRRGLVRTVLSLAGLAAGAVVGARVAPHLLGAGTRSHYGALLAFGGAIAGAELLQLAGAIVGRMVRTGLHLAPPLALLDSLGGLAAGAAWGLTLAWVAGAVALELPGHPGWHRSARESHVLHRLNSIAPPRDVLRLGEGVTARL